MYHSSTAFFVAHRQDAAVLPEAHEHGGRQRLRRRSRYHNHRRDQGHRRGACALSRLRVVWGCVGACQGTSRAFVAASSRRCRKPMKMSYLLHIASVVCAGRSSGAACAVGVACVFGCVGGAASPVRVSRVRAARSRPASGAPASRVRWSANGGRAAHRVVQHRHGLRCVSSWLGTPKCVCC